MLTTNGVARTAVFLFLKTVLEKLNRLSHKTYPCMPFFVTIDHKRKDECCSKCRQVACHCRGIVLQKGATWHTYCPIPFISDRFWTHRVGQPEHVWSSTLVIPRGYSEAWGSCMHPTLPSEGLMALLFLGGGEGTWKTRKHSEGWGGCTWPSSSQNTFWAWPECSSGGVQRVGCPEPWISLSAVFSVHGCSRNETFTMPRHNCTHKINLSLCLQKQQDVL